MSKKEIFPAIAILIFTAIVLVVLQLLATGVSGETDSITHYQIARYAFKYPHFFLDHWGKPLFTILSAPLAQFGYTGAIAFNLLCGLLSGWLAYLVSRKLNYRFAWVAILFAVFTPLYLFIMYTSLTEILFSLVLILAVYCFVSERPMLAAFVISFIPFVRTEGLMYVALFVPAVILVRQYRALPLLLAGFMAFALAGLPVYHDFFWFFTKMPYGAGGSALYGSGSFWFYIRNFDFILNYPLLIMGITGLVAMIAGFTNVKERFRETRFVTIYVLLLPAFFGFVLAQSFLWWQGLMGVLGSNRFMACVLPLHAVIATAGFDWVMRKSGFNRIVQIALGLLIVAMVVSKPFSYKIIPMRPQNNFAVMQRLTDWLKASPYKDRRVIYSDQSFPFFMDIDPFDTQRCFKQYNYENIDPSNLLKPGELLVWDAQFSAFEGKLPFDSLMKNNNLRLLNIFTPIESFTVIGGQPYKLAVFVKAPRDTAASDFSPVFFNNFEKPLPAEQQKHVTAEQSFSAGHSVQLDKDYIYSPGFEGKLADLPGTGNVYLRVSAKILCNEAADKGKVILVLSVDDNNHKVYKYITAGNADVKYLAGQWSTLTLTDMLDRNLPPGGNYKMYVWYQGNGKVYVDDIKAEVMRVGE